MSWWADAECRRQVDPDLFFPNGSSLAAKRQAAEAKQVCGRCPVRDPCLQWALDAGDDILGVWGGATENERSRVPRTRVG